MASKALHAQHVAYSGMDQARLGYEPRYKIGTLPILNELHCHDFYELYIHFQGAKRLYVDDFTLTLQPNQLVILPPFVMHGLMEKLPDSYERGYLFMAVDTMRKLGGDQIDLDRYFSSFAEHGQYRFQLTASQAERCKELLQQLEQQVHLTDALDRFSRVAKLLTLMDELCTVTRSGAIDTNMEEYAPHRHDDPIEQVLSYINTHFTEKLTLEELSHQYGVSTSYVSHEFVRYTGRSVYDYILYRRILLAKQRLNGTMSMTDIAYQCGFSDYSCFLRAFNKISGQSPSAYRKQIQQNEGCLTEKKPNKSYPNE